MDETPAYRLDIHGVDDPHDRTPQSVADGPRPWVGIRFDCCGVYTRVYRNPQGTAYHGRCPRCLKPVTLRVGEGGTDARFFVAE